jgi:hypothetical protein
MHRRTRHDIFCWNYSSVELQLRGTQFFPGKPEICIPTEYLRGVPTLLLLYIYRTSFPSVWDWLSSSSSSNSISMLRIQSLPHSCDFNIFPTTYAGFIFQGDDSFPVGGSDICREILADYIPSSLRYVCHLPGLVRPTLNRFMLIWLCPRLLAPRIRGVYGSKSQHVYMYILAASSADELILTSRLHRRAQRILHPHQPASSIWAVSSLRSRSGRGIGRRTNHLQRQSHEVGIALSHLPL